MTQRVSIFPLAGALLFPRMHLPLHIFEPRYQAMVSDALARDRRIGMIQPRGPGEPAPLFDIGCVGQIIDVEAMEDGCYDIVLQGVSRFRVLRELDVPTLFRQVEAEMIGDDAEAVLGLGERAAIEMESHAFADAQGYAVDWDAVGRLDDESLVNGIAQIAPFDVASKQALLESPTLGERARLVMQLMRFYSRHDGDDTATLQ